MEINMVRLKLKKDKIINGLKEIKINAESSVINETGCRRFDVIQDEEDPSRIALCEIFNDQSSVDNHFSQEYFKKFRDASRDFLEEDSFFSHCKLVFPIEGDWDSKKNNAPVDDAFLSGLYVIHAQLVIKEDRVDDFIREIKLDAVGSVNEEQGCLRFDVFQDIKTPNHIFLYEVYSNLSAFEYHVTTPHFKKWSDAAGEMFVSEKENIVIKGKNIFPPDNWNWSSGNPAK